MAVLGRLVRMARACCAVASPKNVTHPRPCSPVLPRRFYHRSAEHQSHSNASEVLPHRSAPDAWRPYAIFPAILAGLFGVGVPDMAYLDGDEEIDSMITFGLPDRQNRQEIAAQYAKHLTKSELEEFAALTEDSICSFTTCCKAQAKLAEEIVALNKLKYTFLEELRAQEKELFQLKAEKMEYDREREEKKIPQENEKLRLKAEKREFARREVNERAERDRLEREEGIMTRFYFSFAFALLAILMTVLATKAFLCLIPMTKHVKMEKKKGLFHLCKNT